MKYIFLLLTASILFIGCGANKEDQAQELFNKAEELVKTGKLAEGLQNYEKVMSEFSETKIAPEAHLKTAFLYRDSMVATMDVASKMKKSAELFEGFAAKYPDNKEAPNSLFNAGYIYENVLMNYESATKVYNLFLSKYPKHELADDVKLCVDNMGKTPEEMLNQLQMKKK